MIDDDSHAALQKLVDQRCQIGCVSVQFDMPIQSRNVVQQRRPRSCAQIRQRLLDKVKPNARYAMPMQIIKLIRAYVRRNDSNAAQTLGVGG